MSNNQKDFWLNNYKNLYINNQFYQIFPTKNMNLYQQLNALTRLAILILIIAVIFGLGLGFVLFPIIIIILIIIYYKIINNPKPKPKKIPEKFIKPNNKKIEKYSDEDLTSIFSCKSTTNNSLFKSVDDLFDLENTTRLNQDYKIPQDPIKFAKFLDYSEPI